MSIGAAQTTVRRMSGAEFRSFQETRPDRERWELIKGIPVIMVPPIMSHQYIADNLTRLLNAAERSFDQAQPLAAGCFALRPRA